MNLKKIISGCLIGSALMTALSIPAFASYTVYPNSSMSTSTSKYYSDTTSVSYLNMTDSILCTYKFTPVWRVNSSNSISATSEASTFEKGGLLSLWKLAASSSSWYGQAKSGSRVIESYFAEGIAVGWGVNLSGSVGIKGGSNGFDATVSTSASVTVGQAFTQKFQAIAYTGSNWNSCRFAYSLYD